MIKDNNEIENTPLVEVEETEVETYESTVVTDEESLEEQIATIEEVIEQPEGEYLTTEESASKEQITTFSDVRPGEYTAQANRNRQLIESARHTGEDD